MIQPVAHPAARPALFAALPLIAGSLLAPAPVAAQAWPAKPIRMIVPFGSGGAIDGIVRPMQAQQEKALGQPLIIEYRPGAGGSLGAALVAKERPDGYTLLAGPAGMPPEIVNRLAEVTYTAMRDPAVRRAHELIGLESLGEPTPAQIT